MVPEKREVTLHTKKLPDVHVRYTRIVHTAYSLYHAPGAPSTSPIDRCLCRCSGPHVLVTMLLDSTGILEGCTYWYGRLSVLVFSHPGGGCSRLNACKRV